MKARNAWLLLATPFLSAALIYGASLLRDTSTITSSIGVFPTQTAKQRAAILRLSQDLQEYPEANVFVIEDEAANTFMKYTRMGKDNEVVVGRNKSILFYSYTRLGQKYGANSTPFPEKAIHETAKVQGDIKILRQIVAKVIKEEN